MTVQIVEQSVEALAVIAGQLACDGLKLRITEAVCIELGLLAGDEFVLHLIAQYGQALAEKHGILILHEFHSLSVGLI